MEPSLPRDSGSRRAPPARDAFGVTPAYWGLRDADLVASPWIDEVATHCAGELDDDAVLDFLALGFVRDPQVALFNGVHRLPPGHRLELHDGVPSVQRWYDVPAAAYPVGVSDGKIVTDFWERFVEAVAARVETAGARQLVVSLSGGLDSVAVACALCEVVGRERVLGITFGFADDTLDVEPRAAQRAAHDLGIDWEMFDGGHDDPLAPAPAQPTYYPVPALTASGKRWHELTDGAAVFFGHGGDSVLAADPRFWRTRLRAGQWATAGIELTRTVLVHRLRPGFGTTRLRARLRRAPMPAAASGLIAAQLREEATRRLASLQEPWTMRGAELMVHPWWSRVFDSFTQSQADALMMFPFFDEELAAFSATVPTAPWLVDKELLRSALRGRISDAIRLRPKTPLRADPLLKFAPENMRRAITEVESAGLERLVNVDAFRERVRRGSCRFTEHADLTRALALARMVLRVEGRQ